MRRFLIASTFLMTTFACREPEQDQRSQKEPAGRTEPAPGMPEQRARTEQPPGTTADRSAARAEERARQEAAEAKQRSMLGHLPQGCKAISHLRTAEIANLPGAVDYLLPAVWDVKSRNQEVSDIANAFLDAGIVSPKDLQEVAVCVLDAPTAKEAMNEPRSVSRKTDVVVLAKTTAKQGQLVAELRKKRGAQSETVNIDGLDVFHDTARDLYIGQTDDGTIIGGVDRATFKKAMKGGGDYRVPAEASISLLFPRETVSYVIGRFGDPAAKKLAGDVERSAIVFDAKTKELALRVDMPDHTRAAELGGLFKARLETWKAQAPADQTEVRFASLLRDAKVDYQDDVLVLKVPVSDEQIEATMKNLAEPFTAAPQGGV